MPEGGWGREDEGIVSPGVQIEAVVQDFDEDFCHAVLLCEAAVVLDGQNDRVPAHEREMQS